MVTKFQTQLSDSTTIHSRMIDLVILWVCDKLSIVFLKDLALQLLQYTGQQNVLLDKVNTKNLCQLYGCIHYLLEYKAEKDVTWLNSLMLMNGMVQKCFGKMSWLSKAWIGVHDLSFDWCPSKVPESGRGVHIIVFPCLHRKHERVWTWSVGGRSLQGTNWYIWWQMWGREQCIYVALEELFTYELCTAISSDVDEGNSLQKGNVESSATPWKCVTTKSSRYDCSG